MQEKPRFGIALAGVGGCLCIAAGIVITAPRESAVPSVHGLPAARAERLPRLPMPSWSDVATHVASSVRRASRGRSPGDAVFRRAIARACRCTARRGGDCRTAGN